MTDRRVSPRYDVALVEALLLEVAAELHPEHLSVDKLTLKIIRKPKDRGEIEIAAQAISNLREVGLFKDRDDEIVEPTPAALRAVALLT